MAKFKVGDIVIPKSLDSWEIYNGLAFISDMLKYAGKEITITKIIDPSVRIGNEDEYILKGCLSFHWNNEMLLPKEIKNFCCLKYYV